MTPDHQRRGRRLRTRVVAAAMLAVASLFAVPAINAGSTPMAPVIQHP